MNKKEALTQLEIMATNATGRLGSAKSEEEKALLGKEIEALDMGITAINLRNSLILISSGTVEEPKTGHWEQERIISIEDAQISMLQLATCPNCKRIHTTPYRYCFDEYAYCPNCGAKLERSKE